MQVIRFWKPFNVLCQFTDSDGRTTLADYIPVPKVYAAGRLDYDSEGLLLLTDSDVLAHRLTDPRFEHPKTYWVQVEKAPSEADLDQLRAGITLRIDREEFRTRPAQVRLLDSAPDIPARTPPIRYRANIPTAWLELTIHEGKKRQIRRMTAAIGFPTLRLIRVRIGEIGLDGLQPGVWQALTVDETRRLMTQLRLRA
ncbi:MAG: pseudouridine synthase [Anaerolineae bacterium]